MCMKPCMIVIELVYCPTEQMTADILTKPLSRGRFETLRLDMGLKNLFSNQFKWECCGSKLTLLLVYLMCLWYCGFAYFGHLFLGLLELV